MDTVTWVAVVRSRWNLEVMAQQYAGVDGRRVSARERFVCRPLGADLSLILAQDCGKRLVFVNAGELERLGLDAKAALDLGWSNCMKKIAANGDVRFAAVPEFGWVPAIAGADECVTLLTQPESLRALPVTGRHLVFAPSTCGFWVTGTENRSGIELLCGIAASEFEQAAAKPLSAVPFTLDDDGQWGIWQPTPDDPSFWPIRELQILQADALYEEQRQMLRRQTENDLDAPHVARFAADSFNLSGKECVYSYCVWGDCTALLPKTDIVELKPLLNHAELERDEGAAPCFGEPIRVAWEALAADLKPQGLYPERYLAVNFPSPEKFGRLAQGQIHDPSDLFQASRSVPQPSPASVGTEAVTASVPQSPGPGRVLAVVGVIALALLLLAGSGTFAFVKIVRSLSRTKGPAVPSPVPQMNDVAKAIREQHQAFGDALEGVQRTLKNFDDAVQTTNRSPVQEFPELPTPQTPLPVLKVEARELISVANSKPTGSQIFRDQLEGDGWLVGFRVVTGSDWGGVLRGLQPIYQQEDRYSLGEYVGDPGGVWQSQLLAQPGFAISKVEIQRGLVFNALRVTFSRVNGTRFDLAKSYQSEWLGLEDGRPSEAIAGGGFPIIGITGGYKQGCFVDISLLRSRSRGDGGPEFVEWLPPGELDDLPEASEPLPTFKTVMRQMVATRGRLGNEPGHVVDEASDGFWLVGFRVTTGKQFGGVLQSLRPIYQNGDEYSLGKTLGVSGGERQTQVLARPGYAVVKVELQRGLVVNGIRLTFARIVGERFDLADSYKSPWLGYSDSRTIESLSSGGEPLVGLSALPAGECLGDLQVIRAVVKPGDGK